MRKKLTHAIIWLGCMLLCNHLFAQATPDDALTTPERSAVALYNKAMGDKLGIYRGPAVVDYVLHSNGNANFKDTTDYFEEGVVNYDNRIYYHVPLIYNIERDMLESRIDNVTRYTLLTDRVIYFDMMGHHFIRLVPEANNKVVSAGFYEVLYNGKIEALARYVKTVQTKVDARMTMNEFFPKTTYFIKKGTVYYNVSSRGKLLDALADKKKELQQYIKDNKIDYSDNPARAVAVLAAYYDHLNN